MAETSLIDLTALRRSPLAHLAGELAERSTQGERGVALRELPFLSMVGIRIAPGSAEGKALSGIIGLPWPGRHGEVAGSADGVAILWLGPDEFLLVDPDETVALPPLAQWQHPAPGALVSLSTHPLTVRLSQELADSHSPGQVVDLSANRTTLELSGPSARAVLEKGCHVDLHPRAFGPGQAVSTALGPVQVVLWQTQDQTYRIMPRASFAEYTARWLLDAMTEYSSPGIA